MEKDLFKKFSWLKNTHMDLLAEVIPEDMLIRLLTLFMDRPEKERIVRFPKRQTVLKCLAHYYGERVERGELLWKEVMKELKGDYPTLKKLREKTRLKISQKEMKKLHAQRKREIEDEK